MNILYIVSAKTQHYNNLGINWKKDEYKLCRNLNEISLSEEVALLKNILLRIKNYSYSPDAFCKVKFKRAEDLENRIEEALTEDKVILLAKEVLEYTPPSKVNYLYNDLKKILDSEVIKEFLNGKENPYYTPLDSSANIFLIVQKCFPKEDPISITDSLKNYTLLVKNYISKYHDNKVVINAIRILAHKNDFYYNGSPEKNMTYVNDNQGNPISINGVSDVKIRTFSHLEDDSPREFPVVHEILKVCKINSIILEKFDKVFGSIIETYSHLFEEHKLN